MKKKFNFGRISSENREFWYDFCNWRILYEIFLQHWQPRKDRLTEKSGGRAYWVGSNCEMGNAAGYDLLFENENIFNENKFKIYIEKLQLKTNLNVLIKFWWNIENWWISFDKFKYQMGCADSGWLQPARCEASRLQRFAEQVTFFLICCLNFYF